MEPGRPRRCHGSGPTAEAALDDDDLVTRVRAGDREAYDALVARHTASAYRTAVLLGAGPDAEDVVQEAFVKAYRKLSRYRAEASFRSWLLAIVANETRNLHRTRTRRDGLTLRAAAVDPVATVTADDGLDAVLAAESEQALLVDIVAHARDAHGMHEVPPEVMDQIKAVITDR